MFRLIAVSVIFPVESLCNTMIAVKNEVDFLFIYFLCVYYLYVIFPFHYARL